MVDHRLAGGVESESLHGHFERKERYTVGILHFAIELHLHSERRFLLDGCVEASDELGARDCFGAHETVTRVFAIR